LPEWAGLPNHFKDLAMPLDSKPAPATITLKQMAAELAASQDMPKSQAEAVVGELMALTTRHLQSGDKVRLTGLGILQVKDRPARMGRNPGTAMLRRGPASVSPRKSCSRQDHGAAPCA
jgi:nucleoid DNA-binding protein